MSDSNPPSPEPFERPDLLEVGRGRLSPIELRQVRFIRSTYDSPRLDRLIRLVQRSVSTWWIHVCTRRLRRVHGYDRIPRLDPKKSYIFVCNHRSFFDLYLITMDLLKRGMNLRIMFPVRAPFFYDSYLGLVVNGLMSCFAMYPPIFREKNKAFVNPASLRELTYLIRRGGFFVGVHPEGRRNTGPDPLELLPAQPGVGRIIRDAQVPVIPVFINGLLPDDFTRQVVSNFDGTGQRINIVFGHPIDFSKELTQKPSPRLYRAISERCLDAIRALGLEEQALRKEADESDSLRQLRCG